MVNLSLVPIARGLGELTYLSNAAQMLANMPQKFYASSTIMADILAAQGAQLDQLQAAVTDVLLAAYLTTAPDWSLTLWEQEFGLAFNGALSSTQRRARIAPLLLGGVMPTIPSVANLLAPFNLGAFTIEEDIPTYTVWFRVAAQTNLPANWLAVLTTLRQTLPAHLAIVVNFGTPTWDYIDSLNWTWDQLDSYLLSWNQLEVL
jgi:hypothetical protein